MCTAAAAETKNNLEAVETDIDLLEFNGMISIYCLLTHFHWQENKTTIQYITFNIERHTDQ
ncbi:hypothetical protein ACJX0J_022868, partial [Zea mays]